jgi:hypothetical protein
MTGAAKIGAPLRFERYTDEFLCHHPGLRVQNLAPLRVRVQTRAGLEDDAVALAQLQARRQAINDVCERLQSCHEQRMEAAFMARQAWDARRRSQRRGDAEIMWAIAHACLHHFSRLLPHEPALNPLRRPSTIELLARHIGTVHAAGISAQRLAEAQLRLATCEAAVNALRGDLATLRKAVQRDLSHSARPSDLVNHPKLRARLDAVLESHVRLQKPPPNLLGVDLPCGAQRIRLPALLSADVGTEGTPASTCVL